MRSLKQENSEIGGNLSDKEVFYVYFTCLWIVILHLVASGGIDDMSHSDDELVSAAILEILEAFDQKWEAVIRRVIATASSEQSSSPTAGSNIAQGFDGQVCKMQIHKCNELVEEQDLCGVCRWTGRT